jgi:hypothetical protein
LTQNCEVVIVGAGVEVPPVGVPVLPVGGPELPVGVPGHRPAPPMRVSAYT